MKNRTLITIVSLFVIFLFSFSTAFSQGSGMIIRPAALSASNTILDPIAPAGYTSKTTAGFNGDDVGNSKLSFKPVPTFSSEPYGDLRRGPNHRFSDFVPDPNNYGVYVHFDGTNFLFRMRMGAVVPGAKGYSILLDTDGKFGATGTNADPNFQPATSGVNGNPGFEVEIDLFTQNSTSTGLAIYDVDGTSNPVLKKAYNNWLNYSQISIAGTNDNGDPDVFLDFYVPLSDLTALFGITASTPLRMNATTVMAPLPAVGGPKSDIYGLDDNNYKSTNAQWEAYINAQPSFSLTSLNNTGTASIGTMCTAPPTITSANAAVNTAQVKGTWTKSALAGSLNDAIIYVYINGSTTAAGSTTVSSGGTWTVSSLTIASNDIITAKAKAGSESMCLSSNSFRVTNCSPTARPVTPAMSCITTSKGTGGTNKSTGWTIWTTNATVNQTDNSVTNAGTTGATFGTETGISPNISWTFSSGCSGGSNMNSGSYRFWYTDANGCASDPVLVCAAGTGQGALASATALIAPTVSSPAIFTAATKSVSGTASAGSTVNLYVNGTLTASAVTSGTISTTTTGNFSINNLSLSEGDVISLTAEHNTGTKSTSYCGSKSSSTYTVGCYTAPPVINTDAVSGQLKIGQPVTGTSAEPAGTTIRVYNAANSLLATTSVQSNGSWTTAGATYSNGFTGTTAASSTYYATAAKGSCISIASANASTASGLTSARCGSISNSSVDITTTGVSGTLAGTAATGTVVNLYEDGFLVGSFTTGTNNWGAIDVTNKLYSGNGVSTGILSIGVQESGREEITCPATLAVMCSGAPSIPSYTQESSNGTTGSAASVPVGGTMTYTITNLTPNTFYSVADATTGKSYADGVWTSGTVSSSDNISFTTYPLSKAGTYDGVIKATKITSADMCSCMTLASFTVLPVTLLEFKGMLSNGANLLTWKTALERGTVSFDVERSTDGASFLKIGNVAARGSNSRYSFTDKEWSSSKSYYRLRTVDIDGKTGYSHTVMIKDNGTSMAVVNVRPNPFVNEIQVLLSLNVAQPVSVMVVDAAGKRVAVKQVNGVQGANTIRLGGLAALPRGMYVLQVAGESTLLQDKLLKVE